MNEKITSDIGLIKVVTAKAGAHPPEFFAKQAIDRVMMIADTAPQPIKDQAIAFKESMYSIMLYYVKEAMKSAKAEHRMYTAGD